MIDHKDIIITTDRHPKPDTGGQRCGAMPRGVKVTHVPSGLTASADFSPSQMRNRDIAISMIEWGLSEIGWK